MFLEFRDSTVTMGGGHLKFHPCFHVKLVRFSLLHPTNQVVASEIKGCFWRNVANKALWRDYDLLSPLCRPYFSY